MRNLITKKFKRAAQAALGKINLGAEVRDMQGWTRLHRAVWDNDPFLSKQLIESGADVNATTPDGWTPLHFAAWKGGTDITERLLAHGAELETQGPEGLRPLHQAAAGGHAYVAMKLIWKGADIWAEDENGRTPHFWAVGRNHNEAANAIASEMAKAGQAAAMRNAKRLHAIKQRLNRTSRAT